MHFLRHSRIQKQIFAFFAALVLTAFLMVLLFVVFSFESLLKDAAGETVYQTAEKFSAETDRIIERMDGVAKHVVFSDNISHLFLSKRYEPSIFIPLPDRRSITNDLYSLLGPNITTVRQINLLNCESGNFISIGTSPLETIVSKTEIADVSWIQSVLENQGLMTIVSTHADSWNVNSLQQKISVARAFKSPLSHEYTGIVEIPMPISELAATVKEFSKNNKNVQDIYIFDSTDDLIYMTADKVGADIASLDFFRDSSIIRDNDGFIAFCRSELTGLLVLIRTDKSVFGTPMEALYSRLIFIIAAAMMAVLLFSYLLSNRITRPLRSIYSSIKNIAFIRNNRQIIFNENIDENRNEVEALQIYFETLCTKLDWAISESEIARSYELEARQMALEAQINPHFLYNTFAIIQTYADDANVYEISEICDKVSSILRYAVSENPNVSTVGSEINVCLLYLELMHKRCFDRLTYSVDVDESIMGNYMPRMILQPLVENAFKHGFVHANEWVLSIKGYRRGSSWYIEIRDNGIGISNETKRRILDGINNSELQNTGEFYQRIGIGLTNIGVRMKLRFGDKAVFRINNRVDGGCVITIGVED